MIGKWSLPKLESLITVRYKNLHVVSLPGALSSSYKLKFVSPGQMTWSPEVVGYESAQSSAMVGNITLAVGVDRAYQRENPSSVDRIITLSETGATDAARFYIMHSGTANTITVKRADATVLAVLQPGDNAVFLREQLWYCFSITPNIASWRTTGNAGTVAGTNFVGTTDDVDIIFKRNSVIVGRITASSLYLGYLSGNLAAIANGNTGIGDRTLSNITLTNSGGNTAMGDYSQNSLTEGGDNSTYGLGSSRLNTIGDSNTSFGAYSLYNNDSGSRNVGIGYSAGMYELGSDAFYIDNRDRTNTAGDKAGALLYGTFSATPASQTLVTNSVFTPTYGMSVTTPATIVSTGFFTAILNNTQGAASTLMKLDLGTSAYAHTGLLINAFNASTTLDAIKIDQSTTGTGWGMEIVSTATANGQGKGILYKSNSNSNLQWALNAPTAGGATAGGQSLINITNNGTVIGGYVYGIENITLTDNVNGSDIIPYYAYIIVKNNSGIAIDRWTGRFYITSNAGTTSKDFNLLSYTRSVETTGAGAVLTNTGSVMKLENIATQTLGGLTDTVTVLKLVSNGTGAHINLNVNTTALAPNEGDFTYDGTHLYFKPAGTVVDLLVDPLENWGSSVTGTSLDGITFTIGDNSANNTDALYITASNTQSASASIELSGIKINTGTSAFGGNFSGIDGIVISAQNTSTNWGHAGLRINYSNTVYQALNESGVGFVMGKNFNTNSAIGYKHISIFNENNAGAATNTGLTIRNFSVDCTLGQWGTVGQGIAIEQVGADGTAIGIFGHPNVNASTNGLFNITLSNTQSAASTLMKLDFGTSAYAHTGMLITSGNVLNNSVGIEIRQYYNGTGIKFTRLGASPGTSYNLYTNSVAASSGQTGYGWYVSEVDGGNSPTVATFLHVARLSANANVNSGKYFSFNNAQSGDVDGAYGRTLCPSEIIYSRTNTGANALTGENFILFNVKRTSIKSGAGAFSTAGSVVTFENSSTGNTDTVTVLKLIPAANSSGSALGITVPASALAPTNGYLYIVFNGTQSNALTGQKIDLGVSNIAHTGLQIINEGNLATAFSATSSGAGSTTAVNISKNGGDHATYQFFTGSHTQTGAYGLAARTTDSFVIDFSRTLGNATTSDDFNLAYLKRTNISDHASAVFTTAGSVLKLENVVTQTLGAVTDSVDILKLVQDADSTGNILNMLQGATQVAKIDVSGNAYFMGSVGIVLGKDKAGGTPNIAGSIKMYSVGDNAFYNTITSGTNTANATYTLPTAMPTVTGQVLAATDAGVMSWYTIPAGFAWGSSITGGTAEIGVTLTQENNSSDSFYAQKYVIANTQSSYPISTYYDTGSSGHGIAIKINQHLSGAVASSIAGGGIEWADYVGLQVSGQLAGLYMPTVGAGGANSVTSGLRQDLISSTTGGGTGSAHGWYVGGIANTTANAYGWYVASIGDSASGNAGRYFSLNNAQSGDLEARTNDASEILFSRTHTGANSKTDNFNVEYIKRTSIVNNAGATYNAQGAVLKLENVATNTSSTAFADTVDVLKLVQSPTSTGGALAIGGMRIKSYKTTVTLDTGGATTTVMTPNGIILGAAIRVSTEIAGLTSFDNHIQLGVAGTVAKYIDVAQGGAATTISVNKKGNYISDMANGKETAALILTIVGDADVTPSAGAVEVEITYLCQDDLASI